MPTSTSTPLFRKPWGLPEAVIIVLALALLDAFTPSVELLPFISGYLKELRTVVLEIIPGVRP